MNIYQWMILYLLNCLLWKWILSWGGAKWLQGWKVLFVLEWAEQHWTIEQIRFYALMMWILGTIWFVLGLFFPEARFFSKYALYS